MDQIKMGFSGEDQEQSTGPKTGAPLAERMRPKRLEEYVGQSDLVGENSPLRRAIEDDRIHSFVLWGPPGTGKTTLARIVAEHTDRAFIALSAVMSGVKDIKEAIEKAKYLRDVQSKQTILFVDEIHRFNKSQQDALLPYVEDGTVTLIGATTENPSFELNSALLSRAPVYILKNLEGEDLLTLLNRALTDSVNGMGKPSDFLLQEWIVEISRMANGDARKALTILERVTEYVASLKKKGDSSLNLALGSVEGRTLFDRAAGSKSLRYDATGEEHYNTVSAFIKSMRDSDPDAAMYYCARMLEGGEDPLFILRRMVIFASEDIGNADPRALQVALAVKEAVDFVGMPEARINIGQGVAYLSSAPKSNAAYEGIDHALADVRDLGNLEIPNHIRNAPTKFMKTIGYGSGYKYAHTETTGFSGMNNLPNELKGKRYYLPKEAGLEKQIKEKLDLLHSKRN